MQRSLILGLGKRGYENKKWKQMHFVLDGEKQHLYFFEHDKKTKPKGLIDLSYGAVYPVHASYFGRFVKLKNAFSYVSIYLCFKTVLFSNCCPSAQ